MRSSLPARGARGLEGVSPGRPSLLQLRVQNLIESGRFKLLYAAGRRKGPVRPNESCRGPSAAVPGACDQAPHRRPAFQTHAFQKAVHWNTSFKPVGRAAGGAKPEWSLGAPEQRNSKMRNRLLLALDHSALILGCGYAGWFRSRLSLAPDP